MNNRKKIILLALSLAVIVILLNLGCLNRITTLNNQVDNHAGSIIWDGLERTYLLHIPPSYDRTKSRPLVIVLHGGGGTGRRMERLTLGGFNRLADEECFIVVYPDGIERHWNDGRKEVSYRAHKEKIDDVGFILALIDHLERKLKIDRNRVYVTGISNGAMMSHRLALELSDKIAAIAPVAGTLPEALSKVKPSNSVPVLIISNTEDPCVPWEGGIAHFRRLKVGRVLSTSDTVKFWVSHNHCSSSPIITWEPDEDPQDGTRVRREVYGEGMNGTEVILYAIEGGGHTWPGGYQYLPERIIGKTSKDINANEVIWNFFKKHAR